MKDIFEASCFRSSRTLTMSQMNKNILQNKSDLSERTNNQEGKNERTMQQTVDDSYPMDLKSSETLPLALHSSSLSENQRLTLDFSGVHPQHLIRAGAPLLFQSGQMSGKPRGFYTIGTGPGFMPLSGVRDFENHGLSLQGITLSAPNIHSLASQVCFTLSCSIGYLSQNSNLLSIFFGILFYILAKLLNHSHKYLKIHINFN